ncbi:MAG TPA: outer membrane beta-barrel protein, partial [Polyangiaceae bacterium]|nr:outer membrane beta-barrel protein [Polyangiaceae bacterium]
AAAPVQTPAAAQAPAAAPAPVAPATDPAPAPAPGPLAVEEPLPAARVALPELPPAPAEPAGQELSAAGGEHWYDAFDLRVFADSYFSLNYNAPKPQSSGNGVVRAFDTSNGFAVAWAGLDISHAAKPIGGTLSLRFGPSAQRYGSSCVGKCDADYGLANVKQAFASFRPGGENSPITLDFGKFDTIYGAEVADSQDNINYTRGVLYWLGQPAFHTGLRANLEATNNLRVRALVVNGWNNTIDNNTGKSFGAQFTAHAPRNGSREWISASLGYLGGPERDDTISVQCPSGSVFDPNSANGCSPLTSSNSGNSTSGTLDRPGNNSSGWRHFVDLLITSDPTDWLHLVLNADYALEKQRDSDFATTFSAHSWFGAMLGARAMLHEKFAVAGRAEIYRDKDGVTTGSVNGVPITGASIYTGTVTLDYLPSKNLLIRLDNRLDSSTKQIFPKGVRELSGTLFTTTLGVVVTTN